MSLPNKNAILAGLEVATTATDYAEAMTSLETATDNESQQIKDSFRRTVDEIRSTRYERGEAARRIDETQNAARNALDQLQVEYETLRSEIFDTATRRSFPAGGSQTPEAVVSRRDAVSRAAAVDSEAAALDLLDRALEVEDNDLVSALVREARRRDWEQIINTVAANGSLSQRRGAENLQWVATTQAKLEAHMAVLFGGARFSTPPVEGQRRVG